MAKAGSPERGMKVVTKDRGSTLTVMVDEAFEDHDGDVEKTLNYVVAQLSHNNDLLRAIIEAEVRAEAARKKVTGR